MVLITGLNRGQLKSYKSQIFYTLSMKKIRVPSLYRNKCSRNSFITFLSGYTRIDLLITGYSRGAAQTRKKQKLTNDLILL